MLFAMEKETVIYKKAMSVVLPCRVEAPVEPEQRNSQETVGSWSPELGGIYRAGDTQWGQPSVINGGQLQGLTDITWNILCVGKGQTIIVAVNRGG